MEDGPIERVGFGVVSREDEGAGVGFLSADAIGIDLGGAAKGFEGGGAVTGGFSGASEMSLDRAVVGIEASGAAEGREAGGVVGPIEAETIQAAPEEENDEGADAKGASGGTCAGDPLEEGGDAGGIALARGSGSGIVEEEGGDAGVAELPDGAVEKEVVNVDESGEGEEAGGEVGVKEAADDPGSGDEEGDAAGDESEKVARETPMGLAFGAGFTFLVVAGDPEILRGVQDGEDAAGIAGLRDATAAGEFDDGGHEEPEELGEDQGGGGEDRSPGSAAGEGRESPTGSGDEEYGEGGACRKREFRGKAEREDQRVAGRAGMEAEHEEDEGGDEGEVKGAALAFGGIEASAAGEHHEEAEILAGVMPGAPADIEGEDPGKKRIPEMGDESGEGEEESEMNGEEAIFVEFRVGVVGAVDGGHEVGVVEDQGEEVEGEGPGGGAGVGGPGGEEKERSGPAATADEKVEPWAIEPNGAARRCHHRRALDI